MKQIEQSFFYLNVTRKRLALSFFLSLILTFGTMIFLWNIMFNKTVEAKGIDFTSSINDGKKTQNNEQVVRLMMRQRASTPKKTSSSFQAKAISEIHAPDVDINLAVSQITPPVTPSDTQPFNLMNNLDFSVFKSGGFMTRLRQAGAKQGYLTVSLIWDNYNDLDLHCTAPNREEIFYKNRKGQLGELDVDMNAGSQRTRKPVENLYFPSKVHGRYSVSVNHFANKGGKDPTEFVVLIREQGKAAKRIKGEISSGNPKKEIFAVHIR